MEAASIQRVAEEFWADVGEPEPFPRSLETAVLWALPMAVFKFPRLWVSDAQEWMAEHGVGFRLPSGNRPLHGCLLAYDGRACVLLNGADAPKELRFSLAHEVAHFLLDYHLPRQRAVSRLGPSILDVFDGRRPPSVEERVSALLRHVSIGFHTHLMERGSGTMGCETALERESGADRLALELLAPEIRVRQRVASVGRGASDADWEALAVEVLESDFGLPKQVAAVYSRLLYPGPRVPSIREWLRQRR